MNTLPESFREDLLLIRKDLETKYSTPLFGKCIESSELVLNYLSSKKIKAVVIEGWCLYDDEHYGSDRPYDEHTWVEIPSLGIIVDLTLDQFQAGINDTIETVFIGPLPYFLKYKEPKY